MIAELEGVCRIEIAGCPAVLMCPVAPPMSATYDPSYVATRPNITTLRFNLDKVIEADSTGPLRARYVLDVESACAEAARRFSQ